MLKKTGQLTLGLMISFMTMSQASAETFLEGVMPFTQAPNCTDKYALMCGRYDDVDISKETVVGADQSNTSGRMQTADSAFYPVKGWGGDK